MNRREWFDLVVAVLVVLLLASLGVIRAQASGTHGSVTRYQRRSGPGYSRVVLKNCVKEDDFGAGVIPVDFGDGRAVLRCKHH